MKVVRPIKPDDIDGYTHLAEVMSIGFTSLPKERAALEKKIAGSHLAFDPKNHFPHPHQYVFVLEDTETETIIGTSSIRAISFYQSPEYFFRLQQGEDGPELQLVRQEWGPTEICGLYLLPEFRKAHYGTLLSYSRFLFMATFPERFQKNTIALLRGIIDEKGESPFWNGLGRKYLDVPFKEVFERSLREGRGFHRTLFPDTPIPLGLLPVEARECIGMPHKNTKNAQELLLKEGFLFTGEIDVLEGGPKIAAETKNIQAIRDCTFRRLAPFTPVTGKEHLISNCSLDFRVIYAPLQMVGTEACIRDIHASLLKVTPTDPICFLK